MIKINEYNMMAPILSFGLLAAVCCSLPLAYAESIQITNKNQSSFSAVGPEESLICYIDQKKLGTLSGYDSIIPGAVFSSFNSKKRKRSYTKKIKRLVKKLDAAPKKKSKTLRVRIKKQKKSRSDLNKAMRSCKAAELPSPTPTPDPTPEGGIENPYYETADWKIWSEDQSAATYNNQTYSLPITAAERLYPDMPAVQPWPDQFLPTTTTPSQYAGFWDDAYKSEDNAHTMIRTSWKVGAASIDITGQTIRLNIGDYGENPTSNKALGINFTSQSTTCMGHNLVEGYEIRYNEQYYYFGNTLRGGPSYYSFRDHRPERTIDSYEALPVFGFHSFGRSGSETNGLLKMLVAGGFMPRSTKDLLKHHGLYPSALLYIYKSALPYANADGSEVSYQNELRHRAGYLSNGNSTNGEFMPYNQFYHRYDEGEHFYKMTQLAASMSVPPPIALLDFVRGLRVEEDGTETEFENNYDAGRTVVKHPLNAGETVSLTVDVGDSYDLTDQPLTYKWNVLYPEQKNITITHEGGSVFTVKAVHDPALPKGRAVALFTVSNGVYDSNPVAVSFYPSDNSASCWGYELGENPENEVNVNYRPEFSSSAQGDITVKAGDTASFTLSCSDPEGFATRLYRWLSEPGTLAGNQFSLQTTAEDAGKTIKLHFICSDGTGAYNSLEQLVKVES